MYLKVIYDSLFMHCTVLLGRSNYSFSRACFHKAFFSIANWEARQNVRKCLKCRSLDCSLKMSRIRNRCIPKRESKRQTKVTINNAAALLSALVIKQTIHVSWMLRRMQLCSCCISSFADYFKKKWITRNVFVFKALDFPDFFYLITLTLVFHKF